MEDAAHITIILDIATSAWLICFYHKATQKSFKKFYGGYKDLIEKYHRSLKEMVNDSFFISHMAGFYSFFFTFDIHLSLGFDNTFFRLLV